MYVCTNVWRTAFKIQDYTQEQQNIGTTENTHTVHTYILCTYRYIYNGEKCMYIHTTQV